MSTSASGCIVYSVEVAVGRPAVAVLDDDRSMNVRVAALSTWVEREILVNVDSHLVGQFKLISTVVRRVSGWVWVVRQCTRIGCGEIAQISGAVVVVVPLVWIVEPLAVVANVPEIIPVAIGLAFVGDAGAVVDDVDNAIPIAVGQAE